MSLSDAVKSCLSKYATFQGRAPRSEYWWFFLFNYIAMLAISLLFGLVGYLINGMPGFSISWLIGSAFTWLALLLPNLSVLIRRLHDTNRSGWWFFICLVPCIGGIWLFVLTLLDSDEENKYGLPVY